MESILVFDPNNYLIHHTYNRVFLEEIARLAFENKQVPATSFFSACNYLQKNEIEFKNLVVLLLGPFVASVKVLQSDCPRINLFGSKSKTVRIFYYEYLDFMFICLSDQNNGSPAYSIQRKLEMFVELSKLLFGANLAQMDVDSRQSQLLQLLFHNWQEQRHRPAFMLECLERLLINSSLSQVFEGFLQRLLANLTKSLEGISDEIPCEAFLFVNDKLLSNHKINGAPTIIKSDQLLLSLLVNTFFKCFSNSRSLIKIASLTQNATTVRELSESGTVSDLESELSDSCQPNVKLKVDDTFAKQIQVGGCSNLSESRHHSSNAHIFRLLTARDQYFFDDCEQRLVFLHSYLDPFNLVPFYVRFVRLSDEMSLICLSELPSTFLAYHIHNLLNILNTLQYHPHELRCFHTLKQFDSSAHKLLVYVQKLSDKNAKHPNRQFLCKTLSNRLIALTKSEVKKSIVSLHPKGLSSQTEAICTDASRCLREVLEQLVFVYHQQQLLAMESQVLDELRCLKQFLFHSIKDYYEFLLVKSNRNTSIEQYAHLIPNLICFIFVDRAINEFVLAYKNDENYQPNFYANQCNQDHTNNLSDLDHFSANLYDHVLFHLINQSYTFLASGQLSCRWMIEDNLYSYCIWFEDLLGNVLNLQTKMIKLSSFPNLTTTNFVEQIAKLCFPTYTLQQNKQFESQTSNGLTLVTGLKHLLQPEVRCFELFYVQTIDKQTSSSCKQFTDQTSSSNQLELSIDSNITIAKRFADKLNKTLQFTKRDSYEQIR